MSGLGEHLQREACSDSIDGGLCLEASFAQAVGILAHGAASSFYLAALHTEAESSRKRSSQPSGVLVTRADSSGVALSHEVFFIAKVNTNSGLCAPCSLPKAKTAD